MVLPDGSAKGLRTILAERGIFTSTLKADDMRIIMSNHDDFANEKTQVEHYVISRGFQCHFLSKFHCELNPIERVWGQSKRYSRAHTNFTFAKLRETINPALDSVSVDLIRKFFRKVREYERAYLEGNKAGKEVEAAVKQYKSHRRVFSETLLVAENLKNLYVLYKICNSQFDLFFCLYFMAIFEYFYCAWLVLKFCLLEIHTSPPNFLSVWDMQQPKYAR